MPGHPEEHTQSGSTDTHAGRAGRNLTAHAKEGDHHTTVTSTGAIWAGPEQWRWMLSEDLDVESGGVIPVTLL